MIVTTKSNPQKMMRMKELMKRSGMAKGTIQFYIKEGLVPKPIKTHPNMAYYDETHLNALLLVREIQTKRYLPLSIIKKIVRGDKDNKFSVHEMLTFAEMDGKMFKNLSGNSPVKPMTVEELTKRFDVDKDEIRTLEKLKILAPVYEDKKKLYEEDDIRIVECWGKMREIGFTKERGYKVDFLKSHQEHIESLVRMEMKTISVLSTGKVDPDEVVAMVDIGWGLINTIIGVIRKKMVLQVVRRYAKLIRENKYEGSES